MRDLVSVPSYGRVHVGARCGVGARIAPPFMEATDTSRLVCVVVVSYQELLTHSHLHLPPVHTGTPVLGQQGPTVHGVSTLGESHMCRDWDQSAD